MAAHLWRSVKEPLRTDLSWDDRWKGPDNGLIWCWEQGRQMRLENPALGDRASSGELVQLVWKGGTQNVEESVTAKQGKGIGSLPYLAQWQGLRGEDLNIALDGEVTIICSVRDRAVKFRRRGKSSQDASSTEYEDNDSE